MTQEQFAITNADSNIMKEAEQSEQPIKKKVWEDRPEISEIYSVENSVQARWKEFFKDDQLPLEIQAVAALNIQSIKELVDTIEKTSFAYALHNEGKHYGKPTIYGIVLHKDRVDILLSTLKDYGELSLTAASFSIEQLNQVCGNIAIELSQNRQDIVTGLLSEGRDEQSAKVSLMRYAAENRPGSVKIITEGFGEITGVAYTVDEATMASKLYLNEIPDIDPLLGEVIEFYQQYEIYKNLVLSLEWKKGKMTAEKIEAYLNQMPNWAKKVLFKGDPHPNYGIESWNILRFLQKFGYKGNDLQQAFERASDLRFTFMNFSNDLKRSIFNTITTPGSITEEGFSPANIDKLFREAYDNNPHNSNVVPPRKCPEDFSITQTIKAGVLLTEIKI